MGKRTRQRLKAPTSSYEHPDHGVLELRGALTPATRREYAELPSRTREDAWQRQVEFLFEHLAVRWTAADVAYERQKELLARFRMAGEDERAWIRTALREHLAEHFPDIEVP
jgi:hypothetical protein